MNQVIAGFEVDAVWREHATLLSAGFPVLRITPKRLRHQADREAARLETALAARAAAQ